MKDKCCFTYTCKNIPTKYFVVTGDPTGPTGVRMVCERHAQMLDLYKDNNGICSYKLISEEEACILAVHES